MTDYERRVVDPTNPEGGSFYKKVKVMGQKDTTQVDVKEKRRTLLALLLALGILQTLYMNLAAFFPIFAEHNYPWVKEA